MRGVTALQTLISRELSPLDSGVVSVTTFNGGDTHNVIPSEVQLEGTIRALSDQNLILLRKRLIEVLSNIVKAHRLDVLGGSLCTHDQR